MFITFEDDKSVDQEEVKPAGDGARSERQDSRPLPVHVLEFIDDELKAQEAEKQRRRVLVRELNETRWDRLPLPILEGVFSLLPQTKQETERS